MPVNGWRGRHYLRERIMEKKLVGIVGAISSLAVLDGAQAASTPAADTTNLTEPQSFAELLDPIPNALAMLKAVDSSATAPANSAADESGVRVAQYHHHHHHHRVWVRRHRHHHHHHHHHHW
jgi:hypothetical protein